MAKRRQKKQQLREAKEEDARDKAVMGRLAEMEMQQEMEKALEKQNLSLEWKSQRLLRSKQDRDWDIHDPERLRTELPPRTDDQATGLGASSMQVFAGEDLQNRERKRQMQGNLRMELERQTNTKQRQMQMKNRSEADYAAQQQQMCQHVLRIEQEEADRRREEVESIAEYNRAQKYSRRDKTNGSDALSQLENQFFKRGGSTSKRSDMYKGMTAAERQGIWEDQARQRDELALRRERERDREGKYAQEQKATLEVLEDMAYQTMQDSTETQRGHQIDLLMQQRERRQMDAAKLADEKRPGFKPAFFSKFNASGR